jgi:hypothetical protein
MKSGDDRVGLGDGGKRRPVMMGRKRSCAA